MKSAYRSMDSVFLPFLANPASGVWVDMFRPDPKDQVFTWLSDGESMPRSWHVQTLYRIALTMNPRLRARPMKVDHRTATQLLRRNGIDQHYARTLAPDRVEEPGIMLCWDDGTHVVVDGNHRYVKRYWLGNRVMFFYAMTLDQMAPAELKLPDVLQMLALGRNGE